MKKSIRIMAVCLAAAMMTASAAYANEGADAGGPEGGMKPPMGAMEPPGKADPQMEAARKEDEAMRFKHMKEEMTLHLKNKIEELQKKQSCVSSASDLKALMMCGSGGMMGGPGMMMGKGGMGGMMRGGPGGMKGPGGEGMQKGGSEGK